MDRRLKRGIYILPSLLTCGNISCGYLSIVSSVNGKFTQAAWFLIVAMAFDMTDGRIARLTKTTSEFGVQLDSLSDLSSFGVAPSIMMYELVLNSMGKVGLAIAVLFVVCSALRLAKFNVRSQDRSVHTSFVGLPTPASAGLLVSFVLSHELIASPGQELTFKTIPILMENMPIFFKALPVTVVVLSLLMVSNVTYLSFKKIDLSKPKAFRLLVLIIILLFLVITFPQNIIFILFSLYVISGVLFSGAKYYRVFKQKINLKKGSN
jgi:CDP-diacylglycerol--serine O-phosphatidyltransferase